MSDRYAYSTTDPAALAAWRDTMTAEHAHHQTMRAAIDAMPGAKGTIVRQGIFHARDRIIALIPDGSGQVPDGWRLVRGNLEPRRGMPGDNARAWLEAHQPSDVRAVLTGHGLPRFSTRPAGGGRVLNYEPVIFEQDGTLWACYRGKPGDLLNSSATCTWTPRRLSEFHAALEAVEAAEQQAKEAV